MSDNHYKALPPMVTHAAAASTRMVNSVLGRLGHGRQTERPAKEVPGKESTPSLTLATAAPQSESTESRLHTIPSFPTMTSGWELPEGSRAGLSAQQAQSTGRPLWETMTATKIEPVLSAIESALGSIVSTNDGAAELPARLGSERPSMPTLVPPQESKPVESRESDTPTQQQVRAAADASVRLLDMLRAQAARQSLAGDDRVSLGDMTLIAFAEKKQQLAASVAHALPEAKSPEQPLGHMPNPLISNNQHYVAAMIRKVAREVLEGEEGKNNNSEIRFGG